MAIQILHCIKTAQLAARKRIREDDRTCGIFCAINTIAISRHGPDTVFPWSAQARLSKNSVLRPPFPGGVWFTVTVVSPPDNSTAGPEIG